MEDIKCFEWTVTSKISLFKQSIQISREKFEPEPGFEPQIGKI